MMLKNKKLFLFDIDGTLAVDDTLFDGSDELLQSITERGGVSYFITNNSTKSGRDYVEKFAKWNITVAEDQFITAGYMTKIFLKKNFQNQKIFVLGTDSFLKELRDGGLMVTGEPEPDTACVVTAYDSELTYHKITNACQVLSADDLPYYATNPDLCCPTSFGFIPDCGAICNMIAAATGKLPEYLGKPNKEIAELCISRSGFSKEETLVVGDRLYTDIACGINAGVETCVLFTGEAQRTDLEYAEFKPNYYFETVRGLLEYFM